MHLFKRYGQPVDTEHDKPSSLTHIDAEPLLKKLCQDEREDAREPAHWSGVLHREALKLKSVPPPIVYSWKLEETREKSWRGADWTVSVQKFSIWGPHTTSGFRKALTPQVIISSLPCEYSFKCQNVPAITLLSTSKDFCLCESNWVQKEKHWTNFLLHVRRVLSLFGNFCFSESETFWCNCIHKKECLTISSA